MTNELLFVLTSVVDLSLILIAFRLGKSWLFALLAINLILVSIFGAKLTEIFGFITNAGNVFYAAVFLATHLLIEHYGKKEGYRTIGIGLLSAILFITMSQLTLLFSTSSESASANDAMQVLFKGTPRIALASMIAYFFAQIVNITLYNFLKNMTGGKLLWFRDNLSNIVAQFIDSCIFFSIAFYGILSNDILFQSIFAGYLIKLIVGLLGTPFLYLSYRVKTMSPPVEVALK